MLIQVRQVHEVRPKLVEQMTVPIIVEHSECLVQTNGANNLGSYVGRLACLLYQCMGNKLLTEINRIKPATVGTIREYLVANTWHLTRDVTTTWRHVATVIRSSYSARVLHMRVSLQSHVHVWACSSEFLHFSSRYNNASQSPTTCQSTRVQTPCTLLLHRVC